MFEVKRKGVILLKIWKIYLNTKLILNSIQNKLYFIFFYFTLMNKKKLLILIQINPLLSL